MNSLNFKRVKYNFTKLYSYFYLNYFLYSNLNYIINKFEFYLYFFDQIRTGPNSLIRDRALILPAVACKAKPNVTYAPPKK